MWPERPLQSLMLKPIQYGIVQTGRPDPDGVPCVRVVDLTKVRLTARDVVRVSAAIHQRYRKTTLRERDLLFVLRGDIGTVKQVTPELVGANIHRGVARLAVDPYQADPRYVLHVLQSAQLEREIAVRANGSALKELPIAQLRRLPIPVPPLSIQTEIGRVLDSLTAQLLHYSDLLGAKRRFRHGLMEQMLSGHRRLAQFAETTWRSVALGEFMKEISQRNHNSAVELVLSCTKTRGVIAQHERFGKRIASANISRYKVVHRGDLVYDPMLLWDGSIGFVESYEHGVVSPAYATFRLLSQAIEPRFARWLLRTHGMRHAYRVISTGTNARRRKANPADFLRLRVTVPSQVEEQRGVADVLDAVDREIALLGRLRVLLARQKRGLTEKLLTRDARLTSHNG